jgi:hypothetical protein
VTFIEFRKARAGPVWAKCRLWGSGRLRAEPQARLAAVTIGREIVITFGQQEAQALAGEPGPPCGWPCQGSVRMVSGQTVILAA